MASSTIQPLVPSSTTPISTTTTTNTHQNHHQIPESSNLPPPHPPPSSSIATNNNSNYTTTSTTNNNTNNSNFNSKKRPLDHVYLFQSSPYFKMRSILKELRPFFIEVLRAPDFQNCEAAQRIQEKMKVMVDLCKQQALENVRLAKCNSGAGLDFTNEKQGGQKPADQAHQERRFPVENNFEKPMHGSHRIPGTYIVGGSAFGWNFVTFHGTKPEYYGRTKESFRASK